MRSSTVCRLIVVCMAALGALAVEAGTASAAGYENLCPSLGEPAFCGHFEWTYMVAVDNSAGASKGDVYRTNLGVATTSTVRRYGPLGEAKPFAGTHNISGNELTFPGEVVGVVGVAVDSAGNFYVDPREARTIAEFNPEGEPVGTPFLLPAGTEATGIAIDNTAGPSHGDIYVASENTGTILKYEPNGTLLAQSTVDTEHPLTPYSLAVDNSGHVYAANQHSGGKVQKFSESLVLEGEVGEPESKAVAIDPSTGDIFIAYSGGAGEQIQQYSPTGTAIGAPFGALSEAEGLAVSGANHFVYTPSRGFSGGVNAIYGVPTQALEVNTGSAEAITTTSATITGTVTPKEAPEATGIEFEWGPKGEVSKNKVAANVTSTTSEVHVHAELTGLEPGTEYEYRLIAVAGTETIQGTALSLDTLPLATVTTTPATEVKIESATLNGKVVVSTGVEEKGEYFFEYTPEGGVSTTTPKTPFTGKEVTPSVPIASLEANKKYHYQLVAIVEGHEIKGTPEVEFTTPALATATTDAPSEVQPESAKLNGTLTLNPEVTEGEYYFEYTLEGGAAKQTPTTTFTASGQVSATVALEPHKNYTYRIIAIVKGHKIEGTPEEAFATPPPKPVVTYQRPTVSRHEATLSAEINTEDVSTSYIIEWGENAKYGGKKSGKIEGELAASTEPRKITQALIELEPGTTYHYRIVATNSTGTTEDEDAIFRTSAPQPPAVEALSAVQVAQTTATITANVNPNGLPTSYALEVGTEVEENGIHRIAYTPTYGEVGEDAETLTLPLTGLLPGTTYHYRVVLTNEDGKAGEATDQTFTTPGFPAVITPPALVALVPFTEPKEEKKTEPHPETRREKYAKAVTHCQTIKSKEKRAVCMRTAKQRYGPVVKKTHKKKK